MRRKLAIVSWLVAVVARPGRFGLWRQQQRQHKDTAASTPAANANALKKGTTVNFWIMPNGPQPQADMEKTVKPFEEQTGVKVNVEVVGWDVQLDRITQRRRLGPGPRRDAGGHHPGAVLRGAGRVREPQDRVGDIGGKAAYAPGVWRTTQLAGPGRHVRRPVVHRGPRDLLPQGRARRRPAIDPATAFTDVNAFQQTLQTIKDKVPTIGGKPISPFGMPGKKAFDLVHHVMPFVWDNGGAELSDDASEVDDQQPEAQQGVEFIAGLVPNGPVRQEHARARRHAGREPVQGRPARRVDRRPVGAVDSIARTDDKNWVPAARKNVGVAAMPTGPVGKAFTFVGGSNLMMFKASKHQNEAWALIKYLSERRRPEELRRPPELLPGAPGAAGAGRQLRREPQGVLRGHQGRPHLRADRAVGPDRERLQGPLRQHPRLGCGAGQEALQPGRGEVGARCGGQGGRRPPRTGRLVPRSTPPPVRGARAIAPRPPRGAPIP